MSKKDFEKQPNEGDLAFGRAFSDLLSEWSDVPTLNQVAIILNAVGWHLQMLNAERGCDVDDLMRMVEYNMNAGGDAYRKAAGINGTKVN